MLPAVELDDGVVEEELDVEGFDVQLVPVFPELPVVVDVVAASATNSVPLVMEADVNAPMASTLRKRICMGCSFLVPAPAHSKPVVIRCAPDLSAAAEGRGRVGGVTGRMDDDSQQRFRRRCNMNRHPREGGGPAHRRYTASASGRSALGRPPAVERMGTSMTSSPANGSYASRKRAMASRCSRRAPSSMVMTAL